MYLLGWSYVYNGMYDKGSEQIANSHALHGVPPEFDPDLAYIHAVTGKKGRGSPNPGALARTCQEHSHPIGFSGAHLPGLDDRESARRASKRLTGEHSQMILAENRSAIR